MLIAIISFLLPKKQTDETSIKTAVKKVQQAIYAYWFQQGNIQGQHCAARKTEAQPEIFTGAANRNEFLRAQDQSVPRNIAITV